MVAWHAKEVNASWSFEKFMVKVAPTTNVDSTEI
jgi:hypothetical protein